MAIKCIIFDVGGVLISKIEHTHDALNEEFGKNIFDRKDALHRKSLLGKITEKEFYKALSRKHQIPAKRLQMLADEKYAKIAKLNKDAMKIAKRLKRNYKICILSNVTSHQKKHAHIKKLYSSFDHVVLSCDIGAAKPSKKIFIEVMKKLNARPQECIYIEDRKEFLETARKLGMNVIHFISASRLKRDLKKKGVKI